MESNPLNHVYPQAKFLKNIIPYAAYGMLHTRKYSKNTTRENAVRGALTP